MYFLKRLLFAIPLLLVISALAFGWCISRPAARLTANARRRRRKLSATSRPNIILNEPVWKQYLRYLDGLVHGDFGPSLKYRNHTVNDIIAQGLPVSMTLGSLAFCFAMGVGLPLGFFTAARRGRWEDYTGSFLAMLAVCVPGFVVAPLLILVFAIKLKWLPVALWESPAHAILPMIALGLYFAGKIARLFREGMLNAMQSEFVTAARAKGLGENRLLLKHAVRIAMLPVVSYSGPMLADLLTGSFIIENIFQIPGIGVFFINSSLNRDYTVVVGLALLYAVLLIALESGGGLCLHLARPAREI